MKRFLVVSFLPMITVAYPLRMGFAQPADSKEEHVDTDNPEGMDDSGEKNDAESVSTARAQDASPRTPASRVRKATLGSLTSDSRASRESDEGVIVGEHGDMTYRLMGYLRLEAAFVSDDDKTAFIGRSDGFRLQNARIGIEGTWRDRLTLRVSADGAADERRGPNETEGTLRFALKDAYGDILLSEQAVLRVGRFRPVFDIENQTSPSQRGFARRALSARGVSASQGFETPGLGVPRNLGVALRSDALLGAPTFRVGYELAIQNGNGETDTVNDNDSFAYSGSVFATIKKTLTAYTSVRYNRIRLGELPVRVTEDHFELATGVRTTAEFVRAAVQVIFRRQRFVTIGGRSGNALGVHAEALVRVPSQRWLEVGYRFSLLEPSDLVPADKITEHTVGVNVLAPRWRTTLQINGTAVIEQAGAELNNSRIEAVVQVRL